MERNTMKFIFKSVTQRGSVSKKGLDLTLMEIASASQITAKRVEYLLKKEAEEIAKGDLSLDMGQVAK